MIDQPSYRPQFTAARVMVPLAVYGCGFGCKYCYVPGRSVRATPLSASALLDELEEVVADERFTSETVVSLGCDVEPLIDSELQRNLCIALEYFAARGNPVQVATKSLVPPEVCEILEGGHFAVPPIVFTSVTTLLHAEGLEPLAPSPALRLRNLELPRASWRSCLLIKPVLMQTIRELPQLTALLKDSSADAVVAGLAYRPVSRGGTSVRLKQHPIAEGWWSATPSAQYLEYVRRLSDSLTIPVFASSLCVTAAFGHLPAAAVDVRRDARALCVECGTCLEDYGTPELITHTPVSISRSSRHLAEV